MESKVETGLMRKTKKELVEIILRKDDVEIRLKEELSAKSRQVDALNDAMDNADVTINQQRECLDDDAVVIEHLRKDVRLFKRLTIGLTVALSVAVIIAIVL